MNERIERGFDEILKSRERTTDMLEDLVRDKLHIRVIQQGRAVSQCVMSMREEEGLFRINRESYLYSVKHHLITSHNYAVIYPELLPVSLRDEIHLKGRGIGEVIRMYELQSKRSIIQYGFRDANHICDIFQNATVPRFSISGCSVIPFKEYVIQFPGFSGYGIRILEYFNPKVLEVGAKVVHT